MFAQKKVDKLNQSVCRYLKRANILKTSSGSNIAFKIYNLKSTYIYFLNEESLNKIQYWSGRISVSFDFSRLWALDELSLNGATLIGGFFVGS